MGHEAGAPREPFRSEAALLQKTAVVRTLRDPYEIVLIRALPDGSENTVAWAMKRVPLESPSGRWHWLVNIPRQSRGLYDVSRSKRLFGVANAAPCCGPPCGGSFLP